MSSSEGELTSTQADALASFCSMTGLETAPDFARGILENHGWNLESATHAFMAMSGDTTTNESTNTAQVDSDGVRAPIPQKEERLYDDRDEYMQRVQMQQLLMRGLMPSSLMDGGMRRTSGRIGSATSRMASAVDPFADYSSASWQQRGMMGSAAAAVPAASSSSSRRRPHASNANLSRLFAPPDHLLYRSATGDLSWEAALDEAMQQKKFLLINVQQADEFASHQLNRDVWRNRQIESLVKQHYIFVQVASSTASGARYSQLYHPPSMPTIAILHPLTREKLFDAHPPVGSRTRMGPVSTKREIVVDNELVAKLVEALKTVAEKRRTELGWDGKDEASSSSSASAAASSSHTAAALSSPVKPASHSRSTAIKSSPSKALNRGSSLGRAASKPIVLDDDDDDDEAHERGSAASESGPEYVAIPDSDAELDAHVIASDQSDADIEVVESKQQPQRIKAKESEDERVVTTPSRKRVRDEAQTEDDVAVPPSTSSVEQPSSKIAKVEHAPSTSIAPPPAAPAPSPTASSVATSPIVSPSSAVELPPEPAAGSSPSICRIQVRLPQGRPVARRFDKNDPIKYVYAFARSLLPEDMQQREFILVTVHPRRELKDEESSIDASGIANAAVIVEWVQHE